jgi:uncharacterized protein YoxC
MWWRRKITLFSCSFALMFLTMFPLGQSVKAQQPDTDGFIIQADRVEGTGMFATIVKQESTQSSGEPMLRIQYQSATIYGMKLTKQFNTGNGMVSITLKANGPVTVKGMTVDTTAMSFKGACVDASQSVPELGMEHVVMVAHFMQSDESVINQLFLNTVSGNGGVEKPDQLQILKDLSSLPSSQLSEEIAKIMSGHLPILCEDPSKVGKPADGTNTASNPIQNAVDSVTKPIDPITKPLDPVLDPLKPVTNPLDPVLKPLDPLTKPLEPITKTLEPVTKTLEPVTKTLEPVTKTLEPVTKTLEPVTKAVGSIVSGTTQKAAQTVQTVCEQVQNANGVITKDLALGLINEAISKQIPLDQVCKSNSSLTNELQKWQNSLLKSLGLIDLLGKLITTDPVQQLTKLRDSVSKAKDGAIIFSP